MTIMDEDKPEEIPPSVFTALQRSGFPFQTAVAYAVTTSGKSPKDRWVVCQSEYPWKDSSGKDEFLDLVIRRRNWFAAVECKKTEKEIFTFLRPLGVSHTGQQERVRCLRGGSNFRLRCEDWSFYQPSPECEFCVVSTSDSGRDQRLLERDASLVVRATDAFALYQEKRFEVNEDAALNDDRLYFSIIVTNAPLYTARYNPNDVALESGKFVKNPEEVEKAPWIRFRKSFTSPVGIHLDDRTVFVIHAEDLQEFLCSFEKSPSDNEQGRNGLPFHRPK